MVFECVIRVRVGGATCRQVFIFTKYPQSVYKQYKIQCKYRNSCLVPVLVALCKYCWDSYKNKTDLAPVVSVAQVYITNKYLTHQLGRFVALHRRKWKEWWLHSSNFIVTWTGSCYLRCITQQENSAFPRFHSLVHCALFLETTRICT